MGGICFWARSQDAEELKREIDDFKSDQSCVKHLQMLSCDPYELIRQRKYNDGRIKYTALETIETLLKEGAMDPCEFSEDAINLLDSKDFFSENDIVKPGVFFETQTNIVFKPNGADEIIYEICRNAAVRRAKLDKIRDAIKATVDYFKRLETDGVSRIWLLSDSA